uniref:Uncharacterized protein n=1 Tax=Vitrella brassicaformis TaxID=1169539 RepID=A0A7S1KDM9_9ALVE|mmetsp:Transcript_4966/g.11620  ORF Transcript_4966/g.11620 Transcript_4966/m.11620 type:complete len:115 (+) Transcript_4966:86-430(+)
MSVSGWMDGSVCVCVCVSCSRSHDGPGQSICVYGVVWPNRFLNDYVYQVFIYFSVAWLLGPFSGSFSLPISLHHSVIAFSVCLPACLSVYVCMSVYRSLTHSPGAFVLPALLTG